MRFKTVKLTAIHNGPKRTISANSGLGLLQMVSEPDTGRCVNENAKHPRRVDCEISHWSEREQSIPYTGVWKPLPSRCVLKPCG